MRAFVLFFAGMFAYFFLPNYMFTALSAFNFMSWIAPTNSVYNNITGRIAPRWNARPSKSLTNVFRLGSTLTVQDFLTD
jgi:hypothetical protein